ncbi:MAG: OmpA family protein [Gammaproteobacteria bacterium]|nr:OmpA family protein [Gammaproteobacteria bacterium]
MCRTALFIISLALLLTGCVSSRTHQSTLEQLEDSRRQYTKSQKAQDNLRQEVNLTRLRLDDARKELIDLEIRKQDLHIAMQALDAEMVDLNLQLAMVKEVEAETNRRNEIHAQFVQRLQHMIDGGQLSVQIESGRLAIQLPNSVLFQSARAKLNPQGQKTLKKIAAILAQLDDRRFQVEGHTDNQPIKSTRYATNWELSSARAIAVVHLLIKAGVAPYKLSAAGYGEYQPRADNATDIGRKHNRRIEIVMLPNLEVISKQIPSLEQE